MTQPAHLIETERDLELKAVDDGVARFRELRDKGNDPVSNKVLSKWATLVAAGIEKSQESWITQTAISRNKAYREHLGILCSVDPDKLAVITLSTIFNSFGRDAAEVRVTALSISIAKLVKYQRYLDQMNKTNRDLLRILLNRRKKMTVATVKFAKAMMDVKTLRWKSATQLHIGASLIKAVCEFTPYFTIERRRLGKAKTVSYCVLTPRGRAEFMKVSGMMELANPMFSPMVVPPQPWTATDEGGYWYLKNSLIKKNKTGSTKPSERLMQAMNILQATPWRINKTVLDKQTQLWDNGGNMCGMPGRDLRPLPDKPKGFNKNAQRKKRWAKVSPEDLKEWKTKARMVHDYNHKTLGARFSMMFKLNTARKFSKYHGIYFPWCCDWRTRGYPIPQQMHPQADDTGRSLLEFADGVPLGEYGFYWLVIHAANLAGLDKEPKETRVRVYGKDHATAEANAWMDHEDPFLSYAATKEIQRALHKYGPPKEWSRVGLRGYAADMRSHLCVSVDGSCNGLQHFSAIGLDPVGGAATNLIPTDRPADIYEQVAVLVRKRIGRDVRKYSEDTGHPCHQWAGRVTRNVVKRAVMTTPYGVTQQGILRQFISDGHCDGLKGPTYRNANYLKVVVFDAVSEVVVAARQFMDWLQESAGILGKQNIPFSWTTPIGVEISQHYRETSSTRVRTPVGYLQIHAVESSNDIRVEKQMNSVAPNVVHSLDASHMFLTILACYAAGIKAFGMVHDSFGTHAGNMETMNRILRETFVQMYSVDVFEKIKTDLEKRHGITLPPLPKKGTLDLTGVLNSDYVFH